MENEESLLQKEYYYVEGCPGCEVDRQNHLQRGLPLKQLLIIWIIVLSTGLTITSLFPYVYFMIRDFNIAKREEDIGYYAGFVGSAYMVGRGATSILWGAFADRYGRKPVIIIGCITVVVFNTLFGLSLNYWMAIITRFLLGSLNGLLAPIKAYACETVPEEYQILGLSAVSTAWGTGLVIGPSLGGFLAQPAEKFPGIFTSDSIFARFPYFLPCLIISIFAAIVTIACFWIPETLHTHKSERQPTEVEAQQSETMSCRKSLFKNWPLMSSIIVYCVFSLHDMAYTEIFSLWGESPRRFGGLSYTTKDIGTILAISGFGLLLFQSSLYPTLQKILGPIMVARVLGIITIPLLTSYHYIAMLSGIRLSILITVASLFMTVLMSCIDTGLSVLQNRAVEQHQRGAANGIAVTLMSFFKAAGPAGGGILYSWALKRQNADFLPGDQMVFFILNVIEAVAAVLTFKPFLVERVKK